MRYVSHRAVLLFPLKSIKYLTKITIEGNNMTEIKREVVKEQIIYEITKEELEQLKRDERTKGRQEVCDYIDFCLRNFRYEINVGGLCKFIPQLCDFIRGSSAGIENTYNYSFSDYIKSKIGQ